MNAFKKTLQHRLGGILELTKMSPLSALGPLRNWPVFNNVLLYLAYSIVCFWIFFIFVSTHIPPTCVVFRLSSHLYHSRRERTASSRQKKSVLSHSVLNHISPSYARFDGFRGLKTLQRLPTKAQGKAIQVTIAPDDYFLHRDLRRSPTGCLPATGRRTTRLITR